MQTRRDHVQAYQFAVGRLSSALISGDPGRGESPTRRSALGSIFGGALVILLCAGFGVYGLVSPVAKTDWRKNGTLVLDEATGTRYIYAGGFLRPTRNYASALLITGKRATLKTPSAKSLAGVPHGAPVGIPGAPDSVPDTSSLVRGPWARCLPDTDTTATTSTAQSLAFGSAASALRALPASRQVLVKGPKDSHYLLWRGIKYAVPDPAALIALGFDDQTVLTATAEWLAAIPSGATLSAPFRPAPERRPARSRTSPPRSASSSAPTQLAPNATISCGPTDSSRSTPPHTRCSQPVLARPNRDRSNRPTSPSPRSPPTARPPTGSRTSWAHPLCAGEPCAWKNSPEDATN